MLTVPELPYKNSLYDTTELLGHGDWARKMEVVDKFLDWEVLDDNYKHIYRVLKQNLMIEEALDNDQDKEPAPVPKKRAATKKAAPKKKG